MFGDAEDLKIFDPNRNYIAEEKVFIITPDFLTTGNKEESV